MHAVILQEMGGNQADLASKKMNLLKGIERIFLQAAIVEWKFIFSHSKALWGVMQPTHISQTRNEDGI